MYRNLILIAALALTVSLSAQEKPQDWANFGRYAGANKEVKESPKAVFMGDSITDGWDNADMSFFTENDFVCRGISGQTSSEMLVRFRRDVIDLHPEYVVILAGTNDVAMNNGYIAPENTLGNIISMCELAIANKIRPILCSVTPAAEFGWRKSIEGAAEKIKALNDMIREYAESAEIPYVDYHSALKDGRGGMPEEYAKDGVHPTPECYEIMERIVLEYL